MSLPAVICLVACHGGPADHFATYAKELTKQGYDVQIHATELALKKFQEHRVEVKSSFSLENLTPEEKDSLAQTIAESCKIASVIITDLGHAFDIKIQESLSVNAKGTPRFAYYDNPEPFVPGEYSSTAARVINVAEGVLFANETLAKAKIYSAVGKEIDFADKKRFGIGYYPVSQAEKIAEKRKSDHDTTRSMFMMENEIEDRGQKMLVYFGGSNEEYFSKAFPAFLSFVVEASGLVDFNNTVIVIQQHPGAKLKNRDGQQLEAWLKEFGEQPKMPKVILSDFTSDTAQILADVALYYQTSMSPQFALGGIPAVQIGHETYKDILVRNKLAPTITNAEDFAKIIVTLEKRVNIPQENILRGLGINEDWPEILKNIMKESALKLS